MSAGSTELFAAGLLSSDNLRTVEPSPGSGDHIPRHEVFSTATWLVSDGRTARSAASSAHCENADESRLRRTFLTLLGRRSDR